MLTSLKLNLSKILVLTALLTALAFLAVRAFAQDSTTGATVRKNVQQKIETRKENVQTKVANIKEKIASKEATLKSRLAAFKDKKKAEIAERVNTNLNRINQNQTQAMAQHLAKMSAILDKLETRVREHTPDIKDPKAARASIADARAAIASASAAVTAQSEKDYTLNISSEAKVKNEAGSARKQLLEDLKAVREKVIDAKKAVSTAIRVAKSGVKEATASGQQ